MRHVPTLRSTPDLICLSHLRWDFVFQRPQHLMTRCASDRRVFFFEEPLFSSGIQPRLQLSISKGVTVAVPHLPQELLGDEVDTALRHLISHLIRKEHVAEYVLWYYTPMALSFTDHLQPAAVIYDCMDELSAFKGAPAVLRSREGQLMRRASLVLTGGQSLYEAKRQLHSNIHAVPSSVDVAHFSQARRQLADPLDQSHIPHPRLGFFGVIDERMDIALVDGVAAARPDWHIVMLGPVVKIEPHSLPQRPNIHYLGAKRYEDLPRYLAGWDVALLPFARNEATRFISPTKTPEYLAAGKPVVSTSICDVVRPYGQQGLAWIADDVSSFVSACEKSLLEPAAPRQAHVDTFLRNTSWDRTWSRISQLIDEILPGELLTEQAGLAGGTAAV
jgi:UDP-galactopyranose mutase